MTMTITQFARLGGQARWKGISKKKRSILMSSIAKKPRKIRSKHLDKTLSTVITRN